MLFESTRRGFDSSQGTHFVATSVGCAVITLNYSITESNMTICKVCGREYDYDSRRGHGLEKCNTCLATRRRLSKKPRLVKIFGRCCCKCGYNTCLDALDFHHLDESQKEFGIGKSYNVAWKRLLTEAEKCILVCKNCHAEIHAKQYAAGRSAHALVLHTS